jgi:hypothetical protein
MGSAPQPAPAANVEHLKMIQSVIDRLAQNSFATKNWSVGLIAAILAFSTVTQQAQTAVIAFFPLICFFWLDVYYLRQERLFRVLYRAAASGGVEAFSMSTHPYEKNENVGVLSVVKSPAIWLVHGSILVVILLVVAAAMTILSTKGQG